MSECIICRKELDSIENDICDSCSEFLSVKYPKTKYKEVIKCHKKNAKKLKR